MVIFQYNLYIFGIHLWTVLYSKPCYNEPCYKKVVYVVKWIFSTLKDSYGKELRCPYNQGKYDIVSYPRFC